MTTDYSTLAVMDVPAHLHEGLRNWIERGIQPGNYLSLVIANNLCDAVMSADADSLRGLRDLVLWLYNEAPKGSCFSTDVLKTWPEKLKARKS